MKNFHHKPVLLDEVLEGLNIKSDGIYMDFTLGGGGHSLEILKKLDKGKLIGLDQDENAIEAASKRLSEFKDKVIIENTNFINFEEVLKKYNIENVDGILMDLGVSSHQFDSGERGFSYRFDASLDMRMDRDSKLNARTIVNEYSENKLADIIYKYGEEKWANRIAKFIVNARKNGPINTTFELNEIIKAAIPKSARRVGGHPSKQTFQALRIEVNDELNVLEKTLERCVKRLKPKGRLLVISFHSLEDRIVKRTFRYLNSDCICPPTSPICICDKKREVRIINRKPIVSSEEELKYNKRSHSAKLRICEKI
ncbi:MAG: 16S rRNA (cytosine(1402)-N(4))-methyltransferase RsmH [Tissierellia bacterium]|nr:16S rRNA (cytosine(1402)-N(4))-methyltransferase RsmH [Tissierellia bacterium]